MMTVSEGIAQFVTLKGYEDIPEGTWNTVKNCMLDFIGVSIAGSYDETGQTIMRWANTLKGSPESTIINGQKSSLLIAPLVNGALAHALDFDDISTSQLGHPSAAIFPCILSLGEVLRSTGKELMTAYVLGLEMVCKLGIVSKPDLPEAGWHTTGVLGTFGAAVGAGKLLNLKSDQLVYALGISGSATSGLKVNLGTMTKPFHAGKAAMDGLLAALLAKEGFTASKEVFEGRAGFFPVLMPHRNPQEILNLLGNPWDILEPGITFKSYPSCGATHAPIDAILSLVQKHNIRSQDVKRIRCFVTPFTTSVLVFPRPKTGTEAKFSLQFCTALALLQGRVGIQDFTDEKVQEILRSGILEKIEMTVAEDFAREGYAPSFGVAACRAEIELNDGKVLRETVNEAKGCNRNPLSQSDYEAKFRACSEETMGREKTERVVEIVRGLETLTDINELTRILGKSRE
jgi:2-methylcitrate dehydratase PrpD